MFLFDLLRQIFANKLIDDSRFNDPLFTFDVPTPVGVANCRFLLPDFEFYWQLVAVRGQSSSIWFNCYDCAS